MNVISKRSAQLEHLKWNDHVINLSYRFLILFSGKIFNYTLDVKTVNRIAFVENTL